MTAAAFKATYADWKIIKTRGVVQIVFELQLADHDEAYQALGGMPNPAKEAWFAIARLEQTATREAKAVPRTEQVATTREKRSWDTMPASQQAGVLCGEPGFGKFILEYYTQPEGGWGDTADAVRTICGVLSRSEIDKHPTALTRWKQLVAEYRFWQRAPEYAG